MSPTKTLMTVEEFAQLPSAETEDFELVEGELIRLSSGTPLHAKICLNVSMALAAYLAKRSLGIVLPDVDCRLPRGTVRRPDVSFFTTSRLVGVDLNKVPMPIPPDIAVEVISPSESAIDVHRKTREYLAAGTREVWELDQENGQLFVHTPAGVRRLSAADTLETPVLPGFAVSVAVLLAGF